MGQMRNGTISLKISMQKRGNDDVEGLRIVIIPEEVMGRMI